MPPGGGGGSQKRLGPARSRRLPPSGSWRRRPLSPRVPRRGPAADNAPPTLRHARRPGKPPPGARLPAPTLRCAARSTGHPLFCQGRLSRSAPAFSALGPPHSCLSPPPLRPRPPRPLFGFAAPKFCLVPYWFFSLAQSRGRASGAPASC